MKVLSWLKEHAAVLASLALNIALTTGILYQAHVIADQRKVIVQLYFFAKFLYASCGGSVAQ